MTAFSLRLHCQRRSFCAVRMMGVPHRMKDGSARKMIFSPLLLRRCCHSFCAVRKTVCLRMMGDLLRMMNGRRMTFSRLHRNCCCHNFCAVRKTDGSVRKMKFFFLRLQRYHRSFCVGHSLHGCRCGPHSFCGLMNILLCCCLHGSDNHRAGRSRRDCRWSSSCDCRKTCTLRQRRMKRQALPSFLA